MLSVPATTALEIINRALDEIGVSPTVALTTGGNATTAGLRIYNSIVRQLLSAAHWNFARRELLLEAWDVETIGPWAYTYEWPVDCLNARYVRGGRGAPVPFVVADYPIPSDLESDWPLNEGHSPESTRVILTNEGPQAPFVYTGLISYPSMWDSLFEQAVVAMLAARLAMPLIEDKAVARAIRVDNLAIAKEALMQARLRDGNEGFHVMVQDRDASWIRARNSGIATGDDLYFNGWTPVPMIDIGSL